MHLVNNNWKGTKHTGFILFAARPSTSAAPAALALALRFDSIFYALNPDRVIAGKQSAVTRDNAQVTCASAIVLVFGDWMHAVGDNATVRAQGLECRVSSPCKAGCRLRYGTATSFEVSAINLLDIINMTKAENTNTTAFQKGYDLQWFIVWIASISSNDFVQVVHDLSSPAHGRSIFQAR